MNDKVLLGYVALIAGSALTFRALANNILKSSDDSNGVKKIKSKKIDAPSAGNKKIEQHTISTADDYLKLKSMKNFKADGTTLCNGVFLMDGIQCYRPFSAPSDYVEPLAKTFSMTASDSFKGERPDYSEVVKPLFSDKGLVAKTEQDRKNNIAFIAKASGHIVDPSKPISVESILPDPVTLGYLAKVIACEATSPKKKGLNAYDLQREQVGILWCLINRIFTGSTRVAKPDASTVKKIAEKAIQASNYDPDAVLAITSNGKKEVADCILPMVKAFFAGFFNDETYGATHWFHVDPSLATLPPLYYYPKDAKKRGTENAFPAEQVRTGDKENHYINNCFFVRVNERDASKS